SSFTLAQLGTYTRTSGNINLNGTLNNSGTTLALDNTTGPWNLLGGTVQSGTVSTSGTGKLVATTSGGTLNGVTLNGTLDLVGFNVRTTVTNNLVLSGTITISAGGYLDFSGTQSLTTPNTGTVVFGDSSGSNLIRQAVSAATVTFGSGITIRGQT